MTLKTWVVLLMRTLLILSFVAAVASMSGCGGVDTRPTCAQLAAEAQLRVSTLQVCSQTPGCSFTAADVKEAFVAQAKAEACKP